VIRLPNNPTETGNFLLHIKFPINRPNEVNVAITNVGLSIGGI
jgi:hypothetical protein